MCDFDRDVLNYVNIYIYVRVEIKVERIGRVFFEIFNDNFIFFFESRFDCLLILVIVLYLFYKC